MSEHPHHPAITAPTTGITIGLTVSITTVITMCTTLTTVTTASARGEHHDTPVLTESHRGSRAIGGASAKARRAETIVQSVARGFPSLASLSRSWNGPPASLYDRHTFSG
ncbi:hypothetical protein [Streptomyces sp. NPDC091212]|uniref:hypothetical protein n=1 Tax=Streptomyces sp. NPDC091212 TaxID=3155191 RepID=UPI00341A3128